MIVYVDTSAANRVVKIKVVEDMEDGYQETDETLTDGDDVLDISIATGDFNGDGADQIAVVLTKDATSDLLFVSPQSGGDGEPASGYAVDTGATISIEHATEFDAVTAELDAGNLDYDNPNELVVVINEIGGSPILQGVTNVYDDQNRGFALLDSDIVSGTDGQSFVARQADVTLGDIDGDGLEEVVFAGLTLLGTGCDDDYGAILTALDDAKHGLEPLSAKFFDPFDYQNCPAFGPWRLRFIHVNAFDLHGDSIDEVHANDRVWEDILESGSFGDPIFRMPQEILSMKVKTPGFVSQRVQLRWKPATSPATAGSPTVTEYNLAACRNIRESRR